MTADIVFIVDEIDHNGMFYTIMDKIKNISENWFDNLYQKRKELYVKLLGKRIVFQKYSDITTFDTNKRYYYLITLNNWDNDIQKFIFLLSKEKQLRLESNNVAILISHDLEASPIYQRSGLINSLDLFAQIRHLWGAQKLKFYFLFANELCDYDKYIMKNRYENSIIFLYSPLMIPWHLEHLENLITYEKVFDLYLNRPKEKQFVALLRHPRFHRSSLLHGLRVENLLNEGYYSNNFKWSWDPVVIDNKSDYAQKVKTDMANPIDQVRLDILSGLPGNTETGNIIPVRYMTQSYYDIVQETATSYEITNPFDMAILSEKTLKSLYYGRPFLINGGPDCLKLIKSLGFKTCDWLFDESYDKESNLLDRQEKIVNNVKQYVGKYDVLWQKIIANLSVLEHNHNRMKNFNFELELYKNLRNVI